MKIKRIRVAITTYHLREAPGGDIERATNIFRLLRKVYPNVDIFFVTPSISANCTSQKNEIKIRVPAIVPLLRAFFYLPQLFFVLIRLKANLYICSASDWYGFFACYLVSKILGGKIVFDASGILSHNLAFMGKPSVYVKISKMVEKFVLMRSHLVIASSSNIRNFYSKYSSQVEIITNIVDAEHFKLNIEQRRRVRRQYGISEQQRVVGIIGPFFRDGKEHPLNRYFLDFLFKNFHRFDANILFMVIGECPLTMRKLSSRRIIYTGHVTDFVSYLCALDAVLIPVEKPSTGALYKILIPMSMSLPVFTTPKGTIGLEHAIDHWNIFISDASKLPEVLNHLIYNRTLLKEVGKHARNTILKFYSEAANKERVRVLETAMQENQPQGLRGAEL